MRQLPKVDQIHRDLLENGIGEDHIEILVDHKAKKVNILIKLDLEWNDKEKLPMAKAGSGDHHVFVGLLCTLGINGNHISQSLILSPYIEGIFGPTLNEQIRVNLPNSPGTDHVFVKQLTDSFNQALQKIYEKHDICRHTIAAVQAMYPELIYTYDQEHFRSIGLTFIIKDERYVAKLELEDNNSNNSIQHWLVLFAMDTPISTHDGLVYSDKKKLNLPTKHTDRVAFAKTLNDEITRVFTQFISDAASASN